MQRIANKLESQERAQFDKDCTAKINLSAKNMRKKQAEELEIVTKKLDYERNFWLKTQERESKEMCQRHNNAMSELVLQQNIERGKVDRMLNIHKDSVMKTETREDWASTLGHSTARGKGFQASEIRT